jgi:uncharacterized protein (DUF58 family)
MADRRTLLIAVLIYVLVLTGLTILDGALIALALPLVLYLAATVQSDLPELRITIARQLSNSYLLPDKPATVTLEIQNQGPYLEELVISDVVPAGLEVEGNTSVMLSLPKDSIYSLTYEVKGPRGTYQFSNVHCVAREAFGLIKKEVRLQQPARLSILPEVWNLRPIEIRPKRTRGFAGPIPSGKPGSGTSFFGVREYHTGDPRRWINWRISARYPNRLFSNEFEQERIADVGLILDARQRTNVTAAGQSLFEHAIRATAALADSFLKDGNRVGLLIYGRGLERTHPGYGKLQRQSIMRALSHAQIGDSLVFDNLDYLPTRFFPSESQIVLISPLCQDDPSVLTSIRARGYSVLVISPNPVDFEARIIGGRDDPFVKIARELAELERGLWIKTLRRVGVRVVNWKVVDPLDNAIQQTLNRVSRGHRYGQNRPR